MCVWVILVAASAVRAARESSVFLGEQVELSAVLLLNALWKSCFKQHLEGFLELVMRILATACLVWRI